MKGRFKLDIFVPYFYTRVNIPASIYSISLMLIQHRRKPPSHLDHPKTVQHFKTL